MQEVLRTILTSCNSILLGSYQTMALRVCFWPHARESRLVTVNFVSKTPQRFLPASSRDANRRAGRRNSNNSFSSDSNRGLASFCRGDVGYCYLDVDKTSLGFFLTPCSSGDLYRRRHPRENRKSKYASGSNKTFTGIRSDS